MQQLELLHYGEDQKYVIAMSGVGNSLFGL